MPWVRIHDGAMSNPKLIGLLDWKSPFCVWVWGLSYCQQHLTDGRIPETALPNRVALRTATKLVLARLWDAHEAGGYIVHDYLDWNDSREVVTKKRQEAKERIATARRRSREQSANTSRTFAARSPDVLRGVDLKNVPNKEDPRCSHEQPANIRTNISQRVVLESAELVRWFDRVYAAYPNKDRKLAANEQWVLLAPDLATAQAILSDIQHRKQAGWVRLERRFIPLLVKFLAERQWEDDREVGPIYEETDVGLHAWQCQKCDHIHEGTADQFRRGWCPKRETAEAS
jgi:hypothetical protein